MTNKKQLIIFIKEPIVGQCKTRLIPLLGEQGATDFYKRLASHSVQTALQLNNIDIALYTYPDTQHPFIQKLVTDDCTSIHNQQGRDLGERMYNALKTSLNKYSHCVLIGSDCPVITTDYIGQAFKALESHTVTLGPATDGGYVLIGCTQISPGIFANTEWSSPTVLQQCLANIRHLNYSHHLLAELWDIDTPNDFLQNQLSIERLLNQQYLTGH
jgi:uncharacterized protein